MEGEIEKVVFEKARATFNRAYDNNNGVYATVYPGVIKALNAIESMGIAQSCVTNKDERFTLSLLSRTGLAWFLLELNMPR